MKLTFFPTPYPEELWYSVLCRYHKRSGNDKYATTLKELFREKAAPLSICYANLGFLGVFECLPGDMLDKERIMMKHTLLPFALRFASADRKQKTKEFILEGVYRPGISSQFKQHYRGEQYLRYCPACNEEDEAQFGEVYWHAPHQIQAMPLCPKHKCMLVNSRVQINSTLRYQLIPASKLLCSDVKSDYRQGYVQEGVTTALYEFWTAKWSNESEFWPGVLHDALKRRGVASLASDKIPYTKLYRKMIEMFGTQCMERIFEKDRFNVTVSRMVKSARFSRAEPFALLAVFLDVDAGVLTAPGAYDYRNSFEVEIKEMLTKMSEERLVYSKKFVADRLGIMPYSLDSLAEKLNVKPFWERSDTGGRKKQIVLRVYTSAEEKEMIERRVAELGAESISGYIRYCIKRDIFGSEYLKI